MDTTTISPIERACQIFGTQAALAAELETSPAFVNQWVKKVRPVPPHFARKIEEITHGQVTRKELCPDEWEKIWPELADQTT